MNKKGLEILPILISLFTLICLISAAYYLVIEPKYTGQERITGAEALAVLELEQEYKFREFLMDSELGSASYSALDKFAENGGNCEDWSLCKPDISKFKEIVKEEFLKFIKNIHVRVVERESYVLDLRLLGDSFIVEAKASEKANFVKEGVTYKEEHKQISKKINFDLNIYNEIYGNLEKLKPANLKKIILTKCPSKEEIVKGSSIGFKCDDSSEENYIKFEIATKDLIFAHPVIKFKVAKLVSL